MNNLLKGDYGIAAILFGLCSVAGLLLAIEWQQIDRHFNERKMQLAKPVQPSLALHELPADDFLLPPLDRYYDTVERPLFIEGRRPLEALPEEKNIASAGLAQAKLNLDLMGVIVTPEGTTALFRNAEGKYSRLNINEEIDGWRLDELHGDRAVLEQNGTTQQVLLHKPKPKVAPRFQSRRLRPTIPSPRTQEQEESIE